ncbi:MAG: TIR domain-containing protein [Anaerolineae bacterium]|nr:TIR domain-containing protein [Anaerolineae bacterium]
MCSGRARYDLPGEKWELAIQKAIRRSDFFLVCLSANSIDKRGWIQKEIKQVLDI